MSWNFVQRFQRRSQKCLSQLEARAAILFSYRSEKHKLRRGRWDIASCKVSLNFVQRRSRKCLSHQRPGRPYCFSDRPKKHRFDSWRLDLASSQVSLNSVQRFQRKSRKCKNGQRVIPILINSAREHSAQMQ